MFGPNNRTAWNSRARKNFHHRGVDFHKLLIELQVTMKGCLDLPEYEFVFLTGNGTFANFVAIYDLCLPIEALFTGKGCTFANRLAHQAQYFNSPRLHTTDYECARIYPVYETALSTFQLHSYIDYRCGTALLIQDMISAFPYYRPVGDIFTCVSSKQLQGLPVLGIIGVHQKLLEIEIIDDTSLLGDLYAASSSILNLFEHYIWQHKKKETMSTPAIPLLIDLLDTLRSVDYDKQRKTIDARRQMIVDCLSSRYAEVFNKQEGPVLSLPKDEFTRGLANKFELYESEQFYQLFLYSGSDYEYDQFCRTCTVK